MRLQDLHMTYSSAVAGEAEQTSGAEDLQALCRGTI